jgi:hypothetical protein
MWQCWLASAHASVSTWYPCQVHEAGGRVARPKPLFPRQHAHPAVLRALSLFQPLPHPRYGAACVSRSVWCCFPVLTREGLCFPHSSLSPAHRDDLAGRGGLLQGFGTLCFSGPPPLGTSTRTCLTALKTTCRSHRRAWCVAPRGSHLLTGLCTAMCSSLLGHHSRPTSLRVRSPLVGCVCVCVCVGKAGLCRGCVGAVSGLCRGCVGAVSGLCRGCVGAAAAHTPVPPPPVCRHMCTCVQVLFTKFDAQSLSRVVGTARAGPMLAGDKSTFLFC